MIEITMASELPDILNSIRKDLHSEIDRVFTNGSHAIYIYLTKRLEEIHAKQLKDIYERLDKLAAPVVAAPTVDTGRIPEVYFTDVNITEAIQNIEEDGTVHEEDDVLTVHDEEASSEVVEVVEEEVVEDQAELEVVEDQAELEVVEEEVVEDQAELEVVEEEEVVEDQAELEVVEDQVELEVVEDQAEPEDNSESLNEIEVDGVAYYYDSNGDVWGLNEDNEPVAIIGKYNETDGEFELFSEEEQEEEGLQCEEFTYKGRTYLKDANDNVYTTAGVETGYKFVNNKLVKVV